MAMNTLGALIPPKRTVIPPEMQRTVIDVQGPGLMTGHVGKAPGSDYKYRLMLYHQRKRAQEAEKTSTNRHEELFSRREEFLKHSNKKILHQEVLKRAEKRFQELQAAGVVERKEKLRQKLLQEEEEYFKEVVDVAQHGYETNIKNMREKLEKLNKEKEEAEKKLVQEKRLQQLVNKCDQLRPIFTKQRLLETKRCQLIQMQENESRRAAEREEEQMWLQVMQKELDAKKEREMQDALDRKRRDSLGQELLMKQIKAVETMREEQKRLAQEEQVEIVKLLENLKQEKIRGLEAKKNIMKKVKSDLDNQISEERKIKEKREHDARMVDLAYIQLCEEAIAREKAKQTNTAMQLKEELMRFQEYLKQVEENKRQEEEEINRLIDEDRLEQEKRQDESRKKLCEYRKKLLNETLSGIQKQIEMKRAKEEEERKKREVEIELERQCYEQNKKLDKHFEYLNRERQKKIKDDLRQQIEYNEFWKVFIINGRIGLDFLRRRRIFGFHPYAYMTKVCDQIVLFLLKIDPQSSANPELIIRQKGSSDV